MFERAPRLVSKTERHTLASFCPRPTFPISFGTFFTALSRKSGVKSVLFFGYFLFTQAIECDLLESTTHWWSSAKCQFIITDGGHASLCATLQKTLPWVTRSTGSKRHNIFNHRSVSVIFTPSLRRGLPLTPTPLPQGARGF